VAGQVGHRAGDLPPPQAVPSTIPVGRDVPLDGGPPESGDLGRFGPREATMEQPQGEHLAADVGLGVALPLGVDDGPLGVREGDPKPCHP
jgi:hypothetical protein